MGIQPPEKYSLMYSRTRDGFGQSASFLCPYYNIEKNNCSIWKYREAVCSTYICKTVTDEAGKTFYTSFKHYLLYVQDILCKYILLELNFDHLHVLFKDYNFGPKKIETISIKEFDELTPSQEEYMKLWQKWTDREEDFYKTAYRTIKLLSSKKFNEISGIDQRVKLKDVREKWKEMITLPTILIKNPDLDIKTSRKDYYLIHYKSIDITFEIPMVLLDSFDGSCEYQETQKRLNEIHQIEIDNEFILSLYHYKILIDKSSEIQ